MKFDTYVPSTIVANIALAVGLGNLHEPEHDALLYPLLVNCLVHGGSDDPILDHHLVLDAIHDKFFDGEYEGGIRLASISRISGRGRLSLQERLYTMKVQIDGTYYKRCDIDLRNMYEALGLWMEGHLDLVSTIFREFLWDHTDGQLEWTVHDVKQIIIAHLKSPDYRNDIIQAVFSPGMVPPHYSGSRLLTGCVLLPHMHWVATYCSHGYISAATASGHRDARRDVSDEERLCLLGEIAYCDRIFRELLDQKIIQLSEETGNRLRGDLRKALEEGVRNREGVSELKERVKGVFEGLEGWKTERVVRTEVSQATHQGRNAAWIVTGVPYKMWWNPDVGSKRTADDSKRFHGQIQRVEDPFKDPVDGKLVMTPPNRPQCRCGMRTVRELPKELVWIGGIMYDGR